MPQPQAISRAAQAALLSWVNTFPLDRKVDRLEELGDGQVFAQMLHDLDPDYDPAELEQNAGSSAWLTNKRNIQSVFKSFTRYVIHKDTSGTVDFLPRTIDFRAISDNLNADGIAQLIAVFATAAMLGGNNTRYIPMMRTSLSTSEQAEIMAILQRKDEERQRMVADGLDAAMDEATAAALDPALVAEAQLATLAADYDRLSKRLADSNTRLEHLQISYEQIKDDLERKEKELDLERQKAGASESQLVRDLQEKLREQDDLIGNQEAQAEDDRQAKQRLAVENAQLLRKAGLVEPLQDQVQELRHANEELSKKANTVDRYKQKLEAQRGLETDMQNAMYELSQNKEALKELDALQRRTGQQQATIERFREMVSGLEQQIEDNRIQKTALEGDIYAAHVQLEGLKEQSQLSEARIVELEQQLLVGSGHPKAPGTPDGTTSSTTFNLEEELQHTTDPAAAYTLEITRLRAENKLLRGRVDVGAETDRLRSDLDAARAKEERARTQYQAIFEKHAVIEAQMQALARGAVGEGSAALVAAQRQAADAAADAARQQAATRQLEATAADRQREVLRLRADLGAMTKEWTTAEALAELKATDQLVSASLEKELASLRADFRALQIDSEQQQKQLIEALLSKEELRKSTTTAAAPRTPTPTSPRHAHAHPTSPSKTATTSPKSAAALEEQLRKVQEKNDKMRTAMAKLKKQYDTVDQERFELQRKLKAAEHHHGSSTAGAGAGTGTGAAAGAAAAGATGGVSGYAAQRAAQEQVLRNLQRENALMATAWYDLTTRLQSNHVVLQRRTDGPKSWLNKQRQMVNATPRK